MIIVSGGTKGGSGKTTVATNFAVMRALNGFDVLLIDADDQQSATDFIAVRNERLKDGAGYTGIQLTGAAVRTETQRLQKKYDDIIIDVGGRDTAGQRAAFTVADIALIPVKPRSFDVWTIGTVGSLIDEAKTINGSLKAMAFLNCADPRGQDNQDAADLLRSKDQFIFIDAPLGNRKAFSNAATDGLSVVEYKPEDEKAVQEIQALYDRVFNTR